MPKNNEGEFTLRVWDGSASADALADELSRIARMIREGFTSGEAFTAEDCGTGWWDAEGFTD